VAAGTSGSKPSALPVLVLGAGAAYGAFRLAMALTTSDTAQTQLWGGITGVVLLAILLVARRRGADASGAPSRRERRAEARAGRDAAKAEKAEAAAEAKSAKAEAKSAKAEAKSAKAEAKSAKAAAKSGDGAPPAVSKREAKAAARADARAEAAQAQEEAKRRGGIAVVAPGPTTDPVGATAGSAAPAVAPESRPAVFSDLTSPDAVGAEQVAGLAQRALAAVSEQLAALDDRPLDAALITELRRLAARVRRNGDALIVLAGGAPAPVRSGPTDLTVVVGEAVASLDGADRVRVRPLDPAWVDAPVATAIADVVAELVENALRCSPAPEPVEVFGRSERGGYALAVVDRGPGLVPDVRARVNSRLAGLTDVPVGGGIGFEVIARLAAAHDLRVELAPARGGGCAALVGVPVHRVIETRAIGKPEPAPIPVPPGVEVVAEPVAPVVAADVTPVAPVRPAATEPVEAIPSSLPEDDFTGWRTGSSVPRTEPTSVVDAPTADAPPASPPAPAPMPAPETTPRPNLGLGSFADLHAASDAAPASSAAPTVPPVAVDGPGAEPPSSGGGDHVADADPSRWVVPDVNADLLPGRGGKRGRVAPAGTGVAGAGVSWGEGASGDDESDSGAESGEERSDYFDAFRAAADRAREHAGFDEN